MTVPVAVWSGTFTLFGREIHCHTLSNGQRVIDAEDFEWLCEAMLGSGGKVESFEEEFRRFMTWQSATNPDGRR